MNYLEVIERINEIIDKLENLPKKEYNYQDIHDTKLILNDLKALLNTFEKDFEYISELFDIIHHLDSFILKLIPNKIYTFDENNLNSFITYLEKLISVLFDTRQLIYENFSSHIVSSRFEDTELFISNSKYILETFEPIKEKFLNTLHGYAELYYISLLIKEDIISIEDIFDYVADSNDLIQELFKDCETINEKQIFLESVENFISEDFFEELEELLREEKKSGMERN